MPSTNVIGDLQRKLRSLQCIQGGWGFQVDQPAVEPTCLGILALRQNRTPEVGLALYALGSLQNADGSWPAFVGDDRDGCWTTALGVLALMAAQRQTDRLHSAVHWLLTAKGREAKWLWRWRFLAVDKSVQFDPAKFGWSWAPGTTSWVIPTAFSVIALRQSRNYNINRSTMLAERIERGTSMLFDRMCPGGGWNAGNGLAFGVSYTPYIDATSIALLALNGYTVTAILTILNVRTR